MTEENYTLEEGIVAIPGEDGWWKSHAEEHYLRAAQRLVRLGMSEEDAVDFVEGLYWASADCFGG